MLVGMGRRELSIALAAAALAAGAGAAPAGASTFHTFQSDAGTTCRVEVGAFASDSLGALSGIVPHVGYSAVPTCSYPRTAAAHVKRGRKACTKARGKVGKRQKGKRGKKRCAKRKKRVASRSAAAYAAPSLAELLNARLELLGPGGGVVAVGDATVRAPSAGYSCPVGLSAACADSGRLQPAVPGVQYTPAFSVSLAPPPGESWTTRPPSCSQGRVPACDLRSPSVSPKL